MRVLYSILKGDTGELITGLNKKEVSEMTGISSHSIPYYAKSGSLYCEKYYIYKSGYEQNITKEWDDMHKAYEAIKEGYGRIVTEHGKRYVKLYNKITYKRGDIIKADFGNADGSSVQKGFRPAIIVSNEIGNKASSILIVVPITTAFKSKLPTHVEIIDGVIRGTAMCEQVTTIDKSMAKRTVSHTTHDNMLQIEKALRLATGLGSI